MFEESGVGCYLPHDADDRSASVALDVLATGFILLLNVPIITKCFRTSNS